MEAERKQSHIRLLLEAFDAVVRGLARCAIGGFLWHLSPKPDLYDRIDAHSMDAHEYLAGSCARPWNFDQLHHLRFAELLDADRFHDVVTVENHEIDETIEGKLLFCGL